MKMHPFFQILAVGLLMVFLDACYLFFSKPFYENQYISIQRVALQIKPLGALGAYVTMAVGLWFFVLKNPNSNVYLEAMLLGFAVFGTYNATNYALLKKYRPALAALDTVWGMLMFPLASYLYLTFVK